MMRDLFPVIAAGALGAFVLTACQPPSDPPGDPAPQASAGADAAINADRRQKIAARDAPPPWTQRETEDQTESLPAGDISNPLDGPMSEGRWVRNDGSDGPAALFGPAQADAQFSIRCDASDGAVLLARSGDAPGRRQLLMMLSTPMETRRYYVQQADMELPLLTARVRAGDSALDRLAQTEGPIAVSIEGEDAILRMPADPVIGAVIQDCRAAASAS